MCRNRTTQRRIIENAKRECGQVRALYECTDYGDDLVAIVETLKGFATLIREVNNDDAETRAIEADDFNVTKFNVLRALDVIYDYEKQKDMYTLRTC